MLSKNILNLVMLIFLIGFTTAYGFDPSNELADNSYDTIKEGGCIQLVQSCSNCSFVKITSVKFPNGNLKTISQNMTNISDTEYVYEFCNTSQVGNYNWYALGDLAGELKIEKMSFFVNYSGEGKTPIFLVVYSLVLIACLGLMFLYARQREKIDFEKWREAIVKKYEKGNWLKGTLLSSGILLISNELFIYYALLFPILTIFFMFAMDFNIFFFGEMGEMFLTTYLWGVIIILLALFGEIIKFIKRVGDEVSDSARGI